MWINTETNQYPVSEQDIRAAFPNTSFATPFVAPEPYAVVFIAPVPEYDRITHGYREVAPTLTGKGHYEQTFEVYALEAEQVAANLAARTQQLQTSVVQATQARLDEFAKTRNYDGILSLCTYATSTNAKFQAEGQYGVEARDATWAKLYEIMADVESGARPMPAGFDDIEPELPVLTWP